MVEILFLNGLTYAAILFLLSSGLVLMFSLLRLVNLSHGAVYMMAANIGYTIGRSTDNFIVVLIGGVATGALICFVLERVFLRYLHKQELEQILLTFAFIYIFHDLSFMLWGGQPLFISEPAVLKGGVRFFGIFYPSLYLFIILIGVIAAIGLWLLQEKTKIGALIRAGVDDGGMVEAVGVDIKNIFTLVFTIGGALAGFAGVLGSIHTGSYIGVDFDVLIISLIVIVIGGMGTLQGAMLGSVLIGFADVFGKAYFPDFAYFIVYTVMVLVLITKPSGLLGRPE